MTLYKYILQTFPKGYIFSVKDLSAFSTNLSSVCVQLSRLHGQGRLEKARKGAYYLPKPGVVFDTVPPSRKEIIDYICREKGGYVTGHSVHNELGLTEQVPTVIEVAVKRPGAEEKILGVRIRYKRARCVPESKDVYLLQLLDAISSVREIAGRTPKEARLAIAGLIKDLSEKEQAQLFEYAGSYPPRIRYQLSVMTEGDTAGWSEKYKSTLNPITRYKS